MQMSRETTLRRLTVDKIAQVGNAWDIPAGEGIGTLKIQFGTFLHKTLAVSPLVYSVLEMRV
jgi:hypothetical protein